MPNGIVLHVGVPGAGKTFALTHEVFREVRGGRAIIVLDRMFEWDVVPPDVAEVTAGAFNVKSALDAIEEGASLVVLRSEQRPVEIAEQLAKWAVEFPGESGLALPEAHSVFPAKKHEPPPFLDRMLTAWRHFETLLFADTQRLSRMNTTAVELATVTRIFATAGRRDLEVLRQLCDDDLVTEVRKATAKYADGEAGWHVRLGMSRLPPFKVERYRARK